jgi:hypothetical protein
VAGDSQSGVKTGSDVVKVRRKKTRVVIERGRRQFVTQQARYLVIRSAGLVESVRDDAASLYCQRIGPTRLHRRISSGLNVGLGVTPKQLLDFVASFDTDWRDELQQLLDQEDALRSNHLGALVATRKKIAHGDGDQVTARKALQWSQTAAELANWIVTRFDPT